MVSKSVPVWRLWRRYLRTRSASSRDALLKHYADLGLVLKIARRRLAGLPKSVRLEELVNAGLFGLLCAIERFDPKRRTQFATFAQKLIVGAILDYLRELDPLTRQMRQEYEAVEHARETLQQELGRPATDAELCEKLQCTPAKLRAILTAGRHPARIEPGRPNQDDPDASAVQIPDPRPGPDGNVLRQDLREFITRGLSRIERLIVLLIHTEGLTMKETGEALLLSEARVSQIHKNVMIRIRQRWDDWRRHEAA